MERLSHCGVSSDIPLKPGDKAPDFALLDQHGEPFTLSKALKPRVWQILYFYPRADTPGCTTQACSLRDSVGDLKSLDAVVVGISPDPPEAQRRFDEKYGLGFSLLSDPDHAVADRYGAWGERSMYGRKYMGIIRSAFVVDGEGRIAAAFPKISPKDTVPKVTAALKALS